MTRYQIKIIIIVIVTGIMLSCSKSDDLVENENINVSKSTQEIYNRLLQSYNDSCLSCLEQILIDWNNSYSPEIQNSLKDVYDVYKTFYRPWDLGSISQSEWGDNIYKGIRYYIIQSSLTYDFSLGAKTTETFTIESFRPEIDNDTIYALYLNDDYKTAIDSFLGSDYIPFGTNDIMSPAIAVDESARRYKFLNHFLLFFHGHWGKYWHIETHPEVNRISLNPTKNKAVVDYRLGYQGGQVSLLKVRSQWIIKDHRMTWIE